MSSHTPYDSPRPRRSALQAATEELYIDWGPDLPARYPGGRARLMVANPTTIYVAWETDAPAPEHWAIELHVDGRATQSFEVPGKASDGWFQVPAAARGAVHLVRVGDGQRFDVAVLPFATPPAGPSDALEERWGRQDESGSVTAVAAVPGGRIDDDAGIDAIGASRVGYEALDVGGSSSPHRH
ncbi:MAG: hypothetical protein U1F43_27820 [Myxococcota bacterium]